MRKKPTHVSRTNTKEAMPRNCTTSTTRLPNQRADTQHGGDDELHDIRSEVTCNGEEREDDDVDELHADRGEPASTANGQ